MCAEETLRPGTMVTPSVRLAQPLDEGGMGRVWIADHLTLTTRVAVKFIGRVLRRDATLSQRLAREARATARIKDPHVVQVLDYGAMDNGKPYIVMELLEGERLSDRLSRRGRLRLAEVRAVVTQVAGVLAKAHGMGIVHRDIKPENLFAVETTGGLFIKVFDFGVAKLSEERNLALTAMNAIYGTPRYMSPEHLWSSRDVDASADLWALAVTAYEMLTGKLPFAGLTPASITAAVCKGNYELPSVHRPDLPRAVDRWFRRAFAVHPSHRFDSADEFAREFSEALEGAVESEEVVPSSRTGVLASLPVGRPKPHSRRRLLALAAAVVAVAVLSLLLWRGADAARRIETTNAALATPRVIDTAVKITSGEQDRSRGRTP